MLGEFKDKIIIYEKVIIETRDGKKVQFNLGELEKILRKKGYKDLGMLMVRIKSELEGVEALSPNTFKHATDAFKVRLEMNIPGITFNEFSDEDWDKIISLA